MVALSLIALCVFVFGAYAYGATTVLALRQLPVWGGREDADRKPILDPVLLALCTVSTVWFVVHATLEFRLLIGRATPTNAPGLVELAAFVLTFAFPPLIMHTVLDEARNACADRQALHHWGWPVHAMYALSFVTVTYMLGAAYNVLPRIEPLGAWMGSSVGMLFTLCSIYCIALMTSRDAGPARKRTQTADQRRLRGTMIGLFLLMIPIFFVLTFLREVQLLTAAIDRVARSLPMFFLIASVYFEDRFVFYDLIVKRAAMLLSTLVLVGAYLALALGSLEGLPAGPARPWLFAVAMLPLAILLPWIHARLGRWLDRMWFGREFTPVEAVKQVLSAMQPATDEGMLAEATEARLSDMFHTPIRILVDDAPAPPDAAIETISAGSGSGALRVAILKEPGGRPLLSEDLALLRSLAAVFSYMLENVRLQRRRQEQDQLAHALRLQTSRSELKALRAQINPHFLFNALNAIASLIHTDPVRADAAVEQLAEVFRYTLRRSEQEWAPLEQELAFARAYLDVEQARFGRRLTFTIDAQPAAARAQVPSMILHTLVENAVKHGISQLRSAGRIEIAARVDGDTLALDVRDNGPFDAHTPRGARPDGESFGLRSIHDRLRGHFGERASLSLTRDAAAGLTTARVEMPLVLSHEPREGAFV